MRFLMYLIILIALSHTQALAQTRELTAVDSSAGIDEELQQLLQPFREGIAAWDTPIGYAAETLPFSTRHIELGAFITDSIRDYLAELIGGPVHLTVVNSGGIRTSLNAGDVSYNNITEILPFENTLDWTRVSGAQLLEVGSFLASRRGFNPISGARIFRDSEDRFLRMELLVGDDVYTEVDPDGVYTIGTINFLSEGSAGFEIFSRLEWESTGVVVRDGVAAIVERMTADGKSIRKPENSRRYFVTSRDNPTMEGVAEPEVTEETVTP